jgi:hypothetical protein
MQLDKETMQLDKETAAILTEGEELQLLVKGTGWGIVKRKWNELISNFNIANIVTDGKSPEEVMMEVRVTQRALEINNQWIRDVEGDAERHEFNERVFKKQKGDYIVIND